VKLITEILNEIEILKHTSKSTSETDPDPSWSSVASKRPHNRNNARYPKICRNTQPIEGTNRYVILANIPESSNSQDENVPKITRHCLQFVQWVS
jgi:hypothetical protein